RLILYALIGVFRSRAVLEAENLVLRHQLNVLRRKSPKRLVFGNIDRLAFMGLYRLAPGVLDALKILKPQTVIRWHRAGFRAYCRWKSRPPRARPTPPAAVRQLIRDMSAETPLWGAPRIHGELLKLGIDVGQTTVAKYMARSRQPPSQGWKTFLRNHADGIASMDLFVVPTISFRLLYGFLLLQHSRRRLLWLGVTARPSAHWIAHQLTEAYGWQQTPRSIVRDRDCVYGEVVIQRLRAMGIRDRPISPRSPWQNGYSERLIGSIRRDCLDHVVVFGERHLRHLLNSYQKYYNDARTHLSLHKDAPIPRTIQTVGRTLAMALRATLQRAPRRRENIRRPSRGKVSLSELGWPNLLLRDKLPTGNEHGSAGMATVGSGAYPYEPVENWAKLPPGWSFKEIGGVAVDRRDNVFVFHLRHHPTHDS